MYVRFASFLTSFRDPIVFSGSSSSSLLVGRIAAIVLSKCCPLHKPHCNLINRVLSFHSLYSPKCKYELLICMRLSAAITLDLVWT